jgi:hypothetical protein
MSQPLMTIPEFARSEPAIKSDQIAYMMIRNGLIPTVRIGRKIFVDPEQWAAFKASGGQAYPGGWRKKDPTADVAERKKQVKEPQA